MYFAKLNFLFKVIQIIAADQDYVDTLSGIWVPCDVDGIYPKNYPSIGCTYDPQKVAFIEPQPYPSWTLDENCRWQPPIPRPEDREFIIWNEESLSWKTIEIEET